MTRKCNATVDTQPGRTSVPPGRGAESNARSGSPAFQRSVGPARRAARPRGLFQWVLLAAGLVLGLVAGASAEAGLSAAPNPSADGAYTVTWTAIPAASAYQLHEGATLVYKGAARTKAFSGKAAGSYTYTLTYCLTVPFPSPTTTCNLPSSFTAVTVTVSGGTIDPPPPPAPAAPTLTAPASSTTGTYKVSWSKPSGATRYELQQKVGSAAWKSAYKGESRSKTYANEGSGAYSYRVRACAGASNCGKWSATKNVRVTRTTSTISAKPTLAPGGNYTVSWTKSVLSSGYRLLENFNNGARTRTFAVDGLMKTFANPTPGSYTYSLQTCFNLFGAVTCVPASGSVTVTVPVPPTGTISAKPSPCILAAGKTRCSTTVTWSTANASSPCVFVEASKGKFACARSGSKTATWIGTAGARFLLKAGNTFEAATLASVTVKAVRKPTVSASFDTSEITLGASATLSWSSTWATRCSGKPAIGSTAKSGSKAFKPASAGKFSVTVTCSGPGGSASDTAMVDVKEPAPPAGVPAAPAMPAVATESATGVEVTWTAPVDNGAAITDYDVGYRVNGTTGWTPRAFSGTGTTVTITGLTPNTTYQVQVRAENSVGEGPWSKPGSDKTEDVVPGRVAKPRVDAPSQTTLDVEWMVPSNEGSAIIGYDVQYRIKDAATWTDHSHTGTSRDATITGLTPNTTYEVQVRAENSVGEGPWSKPGSDKTEDVVPGRVAKPRVDAPSQTTLDVEWILPSNEGSAITGYDVQYRIKDAATWTDHAHTGTARDATITGLSPDTTYETRVLAKNAKGAGPWSPVAQKTTPSSNRRPAAANDTASTTVGNAVTVKVLTNDSDADGETLKVVSVADPANGSAIIERVNGEPDAVTYTPDDDFVGSDSFVYTVSDGSGASNHTDTATVTVTVAGPPAAPAKPRIDAPSATTLDVEWDAPAANGSPITDYDVEYRVKDAKSWTDHPHSGTDEDTSITGLSAGTTYEVQVRAVNALGKSAWSPVGQQTTPARLGVPGGLAIQPSGPNSYTVAWKAVAGDKLRYELEERGGTGTWKNVHNGGDTDKTFASQTEGVYAYRVRACPEVGDCGRFSDSVSVTVPIPPPVPSGLAATEPTSDGDYTVSWDAVAWGGNETYVLEERPEGGTWTEIHNGEAASAAIAANAGGSYAYQVRACAAGTCGAWSDELTVVVGTATILHATPNPSTTGIYTVSWTAPSIAHVHQLLESADNGKSWRTLLYAGATGSLQLSGQSAGSYVYRLDSCRFLVLPGTGDCTELERLTVTVSMPPEPTIESATVPGNLPYEAGVTKGGDPYVNIPVEPAPGVNGLVPRLSIDFGAGRELSRTVGALPGDTLGRGWRLGGFSTVRRCVKHQNADAAGVSMTDTDSLCLDGEPLVRVGGMHLRPGAEYRTLRESYRKVVMKGTVADSWFEVRSPDGAVLEYGRTEDSRLRNVANLTVNGLHAVQPTLPFQWSVNKHTDEFGNTMVYAYHEDEVAGVRHPKSIVYGANGDAAIRFEYVGRDDLAPVSLGPVVQQQKLLLHTVRVSLDAHTVRTYRLVSDKVGDVRRLNRIQLCGFVEAGSAYECLSPLSVEWAEPLTRLPNNRFLVTHLTDPLGRVTEFRYGVLTERGKHAFLFAERPFGNAPAPADTAPLPTSASSGDNPTPTVEGGPGTPTPTANGEPLKAVVTAIRRGNGLNSATEADNWHVLEYAYQGRGRMSTRHWGFLGFDAARVTDTESGIVTYYQHRMDFPFFGEVAAVRQYTGVYGKSGTQALSRRETVFAAKTIQHPLKTSSASATTLLPHVAAVTDFLYEGGAALGLTETRNALTLTSGLPTSLTRTVSTAHRATGSGGGTPWGAPPSRTLSGIQRKTVTTTGFTNRAANGKWLIGFANKVERSDHAGAAAKADRSVHTTFTPHLDTNRVDKTERFPRKDGDTEKPDHEHRLSVDFGYDGYGNATETTVTGTNVSSRTSKALVQAGERRYPHTLRNPLNQDEKVAYDARFGLAKSLTDPNNRATTLTYDPFGREATRTSPDGVKSTTTRRWCTAPVKCDKVGKVAPVARIDTSSPIAPTETRYLDRLGRIVRTEIESFDGNKTRRTDTHFDALGRVERVSQPHHNGDTAAFESYEYDVRDRLTKTVRPDGGQVTVSYAVNPDTMVTNRAHQVRATRTETVRDSAGKLVATHKRFDLYNVLGELIETVEGAGATGAAATTDRVQTRYAYDGSGLVKSVTVNGVTTTAFTHDDAGSRDSVTNPNLGTIAFEHTALGELRKQTDAEGTTLFGYDKLGRLTSKKDPDGVAEWTYDPAKSIGSLHKRCYEATASATGCATLTAPDFLETHAYHDDARLKSAATDIRAGAHTRSYTHKYTYDAQGRPATVEYPSGLTVRHRYNAQGYPETLTDVSDSTVLRRFDALNAYGQPTRESYGNGVKTAREFDPESGRLDEIDTTVVRTVNGVSTTAKIQDNTYAWRSNGILHSRMDSAGTVAKTEVFTHDLLNRLTQAETSLGATVSRTLSFTFDRLGNLTGKASSLTGEPDLTGFKFGTATTPGPNALTDVKVGSASLKIAYDAGGKATRYDRPGTTADTFVAWNGRSLAETITVGDSATDATPHARDEFAYGPDGHRYHRKSVWNAGSNTLRTEHTFYAGDVEETLLDGHPSIKSVQKTRVTDGIVHVRTVPHAGMASAAIEYLHRDHLGSVEAVTDAAGDKLAVLAYDPYGERRKADWSGALPDAERLDLAEDLKLKVSQGYTGHEHLERTGFVHMNGRVYDPQLGRFLSPDPVVSEPTSSQSWNAYSYVSNRPMSLADPTGLSQQPVNMCPPSICPWNATGMGSAGGFSRVSQAVASTHVNVNFGFFVYHVPVFGAYGGEFSFGLRPVIGFFLSASASPVTRSLQVEQRSPADKPLRTPESDTGLFDHLAELFRGKQPTSEETEARLDRAIRAALRGVRQAVRDVNDKSGFLYDRDRANMELGSIVYPDGEFGFESTPAAPHVAKGNEFNPDGFIGGTRPIQNAAAVVIAMPPFRTASFILGTSEKYEAIAKAAGVPVFVSTVGQGGEVVLFKPGQPPVMRPR